MPAAPAASVVEGVEEGGPGAAAVAGRSVVEAEAPSSGLRVPSGDLLLPVGGSGKMRIGVSAATAAAAAAAAAPAPRPARLNAPRWTIEATTYRSLSANSSSECRGSSARMAPSVAGVAPAVRAEARSAARNASWTLELSSDDERATRKASAVRVRVGGGGREASHVGSLGATGKARPSAHAPATAMALAKVPALRP